MKLALKLFIVLVIYCGLTLLLYAGRVHGNPICKTDTVVFYLPFIISIIVYRAIISRFQKSTERKFGSPVFWTILLSILSEMVSMHIKFNMYGT